MAELEVNLFSLGLLFFIFSLLGVLVRGIFMLIPKMDKDKIKLIYLKGLFGLGLLLIVAGSITSAVRGRGKDFFVAMFISPGGMIQSMFMPSVPNYSERCRDGKCARYCCQSMDKSAHWADCSETCTSLTDVAGIEQGGDCLFSGNLQNFCAITGQGMEVPLQSSDKQACNQFPELGPVTCSCCQSAAVSAPWWDCTSECKSMVPHIGFETDVQTCVDRQKTGSKPSYVCHLLSAKQSQTDNVNENVSDDINGNYSNIA